MAVLRVGALAPAPLAAAAQFHADVLPIILAAMTGQSNLVLVFPAADHTHTAWRRADLGLAPACQRIDTSRRKIGRAHV